MVSETQPSVDTSNKTTSLNAIVQISKPDRLDVIGILPYYN